MNYFKNSKIKELKRSTEEKRNTLKEQLKVKLGTYQSFRRKTYNNMLEKLNVLTLNIFNINSEEDVLKIIH
ncbi:MAG: hypothetical protein ACLR43_13990 [Faecalibacillus faecis]